MAPILPPRLEPDSKIAVVAPAGPVNERHLNLGLERLEQRYRPSVRADIAARKGYFAGDDRRRLEELQEALDSPGIRGIIAARGGFGVTDIIDRLDFGGFIESPKWIVGSSDLTALLVLLFAAHRCLTIHGPMAAGFHRTDERDLDALFALLEGAPRRPPDPMEGLSNGTARGPLVGGNLTILAHLAGTLSADFAEGIILFLEDVAEKPYRLDRCMVQLGRTGILHRVAGVVLGEFAACDPGPDGVGPLDAVTRHLAPLGVPVAAGYPAAHGPRNAPFVHGGEIVLEVSGNEAVIGSQPSW